MGDQKMTAEEWHKLAAKSLAEENKKIIFNMMKMFTEENQREGEKVAERYENSLRDHFAGLAMQGMLTNDQCDPYAGYFDADIAYQIADAMLKERNS
ncbi:MAG: hypothetical protein U9N54_07905 [candidate division Zixibacteria bacterium]|nr:hypothetical protein [candidate division Zixibacteria bacterium]